jgi:outer membrane protein assembly factor BamE
MIFQSSVFEESIVWLVWPRGILAPFRPKVMVMRHTIILLALLCAACSSYTLKPYKMDIQQGNVVTSKMMLQLRPGMNKSQVRFIMGTPLIQDSFHRDRWDYFYQMSKGGKVIEQRRVILDFEGDALKRVRGDVIPAGTGDVAEPAPVTPPPTKQQDKSWSDKLKFWKSDDQNVEKPQSAPAELVAPAAVVAPEAQPAPAPSKASEPAARSATPPADEAERPASAPAEPATATPEVTQNPPPTRQVEVPAKQEAAKPAAAEPVREAAPASPTPAEQVAKPAENKPVAQPKAESKPAAKPASKPAPVEEELPPEDAPGYFERMLEKIGF